VRAHRDEFARFCEAWVRISAFSLLISLPIVVSFWAYDAYSEPKAFVLYALTGLMVLGWLASYLVARQPQWQVTRPEFPLWIFVLALLLSTWMSVDSRLSFLGSFPTYPGTLGRNEGLLVFLAYTALYLVGVHSFGSEPGFRRLAVLMAIISIPVMAYGILQIWLPPPFLGEALKRDFYRMMGLTRILSTIGSPITYGAYLSLVMPILVGLYLASRQVMTSAVWLLAGVLAVVSTVLTLTRAAWIGMFLGTLVFLIVLGNRVVSTYRQRLLVFLGCTVIALLLVLATVVQPRQIGQRAAATFELNEGSTAQHLYLWGKTFDLIRDRPLLGWGLETLRRVFPYQRQELVRVFGLRPVIIDRAHNDVLQVAVSIGIPGALAYVTFWILVLVSGTRLTRRVSGEARILSAGFLAGLVGYLVQVQFSFSAVEVTPLVWLLAGSVVGWEVTSGGR